MRIWWRLHGDDTENRCIIRLKRISNRKTEVTSYKIRISSLTLCMSQFLNIIATSTELAVLQMTSSFGSSDNFYFWCCSCLWQNSCQGIQYKGYWLFRVTWRDLVVQLPLTLKGSTQLNPHPEYLTSSVSVSSSPYKLPWRVKQTDAQRLPLASCLSIQCINSAYLHTDLRRVLPPKDWSLPCAHQHNSGWLTLWALPYTYIQRSL